MPRIPIEWVAGGTATARRVPTQEGMIDIFNSNLCMKNQLTAYCDLVWSTPKYFDIFDTAPSNNAELNELRNKRKLKHVMLGNKIWASLTSDFKIELQSYQNLYKVGREYDGPKLWDFIWHQVNPTTTV